MATERSIRPAAREDIDIIETIAVAAQMFPPEEATFLGQMVNAALDGESPGAVARAR